MKKVLITLTVFAIMLVGCSGEENMEQVESEKHKEEQSITNIFNGESNTWELNNYEITFSTDLMEVGNGMISMKNNHLSNYLSYKVYATIDNKEEVLQTHISTGKVVNKTSTINLGSVSSSPLINSRGERISFDDLSNIYMVINWNDSNEDYREEKIYFELY